MTQSLSILGNDILREAGSRKYAVGISQCILIVHVFLTQSTCILISKLNLKAFLVLEPNKSETQSLDNK